MRGSPSPYVQISNNSAFGGLNGTDGVQWLDLTGIVGRGAGVLSDAVATSSLLDYVVSFDVGAVYYFGSYGAATVDLTVNGVQVGSYTVQPPGSNSFNWQRFSYGFSGDGSPVRIGLYASFSEASSQYGVGLDNVVLESRERTRPVDPVPGVPEPLTWAMMLAGFGVTGVALRRKAAARVTVA